MNSSEYEDGQRQRQREAEAEALQVNKKRWDVPGMAMFFFLRAPKAPKQVGRFFDPSKRLKKPGSARACAGYFRIAHEPQLPSIRSAFFCCRAPHETSKLPRARKKRV
jgi:hypothetical protein